MATKGKLYLIPNRLGLHATDKAFTPYQTEVLDVITLFLVENIKPARQLLRAVSAQKNIDNCHFIEMHELKPESPEITMVFQALKSGQDVGLISDAGCPGIADPGAFFVALAHEAGMEVLPMVGPSSILLTLMGSGLNGQQFSFHGYLPKEAAQRKTALSAITSDIQRNGYTHLFIETPYRAQHMLDDILNTLSPSLKLCLGVDILMPEQFIITRTIQEWKKHSALVHKRQVVFALGK